MLPFTAQGWTKEGDIMVLPLDLVAIDTHADAVDNVLKTFSNVRVQMVWS